MIRLYAYAASVAAILLAGWWLHHKVDLGGYNRRASEDTAAIATWQVWAKGEAKSAQTRADKAEQRYADSNKALKDYIASHPLTGSQLCKRPASVGQPPASAGQDAGTDGTSHAAPVVPNVPTADHGFTGDRFDLLKAFGALCQHENDKLAEWQGR